MRGFASYVAAGILVVLALDFIAPPVGLGMAVGAWPVAEQGATPQTVNRSGKSDRMSSPINKQRFPRQSPVLLVGCEPAFSPLSASAQANFSGRCVA